MDDQEAEHAVNDLVGSLVKAATGKRWKPRPPQMPKARQTPKAERAALAAARRAEYEAMFGGRDPVDPAMLSRRLGHSPRARRRTR